MNILMMICEPFDNGGEEAFIVNVIKHMNLNNLRIDLFAPYGAKNEKYCEILKKIGCNVYSCDLEDFMSKFKLELVKPLSALLKQEKYDCIHIHSSNLVKLLVAVTVSKFCGIKKIITHLHNTGVMTTKQAIIKKVVGLVLPVLNPICFACSTKVGEWNYPKKIVNNNFTVIKNGVDLNRFNFDCQKSYEMREILGYNENDCVIGHVGRFDFQKNHEFVISAFAQLCEKSSKYKLLLIGDGPLMENVKKQSDMLGVTERIIFTGIVDNVPDYMQAMDLFILPSRFEGLPIVGVEAQACGLPVVFSEPITKEAKIVDNVEFVSLDDKQKWIETIEKMVLLPKKDNTEIIRAAGYDIEETAKQLREVYLR